MRIATWNVNSIRTRLSQVVKWLQDQGDIDLLCLQETKVTDDLFPLEAFTALGYEVARYGQKSYNGVALLSRLPLQQVSCGFTPVLGIDVVGDLDAQKRLITTDLAGLRLINVYIPNGSAVGSEKYDYKLRWLEMLRLYLQQWMTAPDLRLLICGDFNIAPEDRDIHDPKKAGEIMASEAERAALQALTQVGLQDGFRKFTQDGGYFSWWDYRAAGFQRNRGWRIDHHYLSPVLYQEAKACVIDVEPRSWEQPSDHAPVILEI